MLSPSSRKRHSHSRVSWEGGRAAQAQVFAIHMSLFPPPTSTYADPLLIPPPPKYFSVQKRLSSSLSQTHKFVLPLPFPPFPICSTPPPSGPFFFSPGFPRCSVCFLLPPREHDDDDNRPLFSLLLSPLEALLLAPFLLACGAVTSPPTPLPLRPPVHSPPSFPPLRSERAPHPRLFSLDRGTYAARGVHVVAIVGESTTTGEV